MLQNAGPLGGPGMPEWGMLPIPKKLLAQGVRDMVRVSDARMSGTSYGTCVLHVAPESFVGGPLALVRDGDIIELDVPDRRLVAARRTTTNWRGGAQRQPPRRRSIRAGYGTLYSEHVTPGRPRLRLRLPRGHCADRRSRDPLGLPTGVIFVSRLDRILILSVPARAVVCRRSVAGCHSRRQQSWADDGGLERRLCAAGPRWRC